MKSRKPPQKVAIVGGGCAGLTAAYELSRPEHKGAYEITVFESSFRLGGKGASGRGVSSRIEEHGLHLWMGFYENAFRLMRECYAELGRDPAKAPIAKWTDAFSPAPFVAVTDRRASQEGSEDWERWVACFPPASGLPGDPAPAQLSVSDYLQRTVSLLLELMRSAHRDFSQDTAPKKPTRWVELGALTAAVQATDLLSGTIAGLGAFSNFDSTRTLGLLNDVRKFCDEALQRLTEGDTAQRRVWQVADIVLAVLRGSFRFGLATHPEGFDAINDYDWRQWLRLNGAHESSLDSGFMRGIYDLVFAYEEGDVTRPSLAAGVALRGAMRMFFGYRGSLFWKMNAGMGDIVFAPLYEVLRRRGVDFKFFHRLRDVEVGHDPQGFVSALHFDVLAEPRGVYEPLVDVKGVPSWPSSPDLKQLRLAKGTCLDTAHLDSPFSGIEAKSRTLRCGADFDLVVLAIGAAALPEVTTQISAASPIWRNTLANARTVATQALQLWFRASTHTLGWKAPPVNLSGFVEPFDTWADMSHLIAREEFAAPVESIAYFCSVLPDTVALPLDDKRQARAHQVVRANAVDFIEQHLPTLLPELRNNKGVRWDLLATDDPHTKNGPARIDSQYFRANVQPSERYSLSLPGTIRHRLSPLEQVLDNLTVAGDWTQSGLDSGCVESAVMSGMLAAHAISASPALADIHGYDHP